MTFSKHITVVGAGYVGTSLAVAFAQYHSVILLDINASKIELLKSKQSPIEDELIQSYLTNKSLQLNATTNAELAYKNSELIFIAVPTNYNEETHFFDTSIIEKVISNILIYNQMATIVIKSTIPIGYTDSLIQKFNYTNIVFSPEFLREGKALYDNLYPSRIVVGGYDNNISQQVLDVLMQISLHQPITIITQPSEAEAAKLFANTYLAMRVAYFNELDSFCLSKKLNVKDVINIVSADLRIGNHYNNPSFGYGGYCLPKDSKQLLVNYDKISQNLMTSIILSNQTRKKFIAEYILAISPKPKIVGIYRLTMKQGSDNIRESAMLDVVQLLINADVKIIIYEPFLQECSFLDVQLITDLEEFKSQVDIIVANRISNELKDVIHKVFTRDIFGEN